MSLCRPLLVTWALLTCSVRSQSWRPCTDLFPIDLLARALPPPGQTTPTQMVQSRGSRGIRLTSPVPTALSFTASQIFTNCDFFPSEFSLVATLKIQRLRMKTSQYILSVVKEGSASLLLGLRISENHRPPCSGPEKGQLWFNVQTKGLFICDGRMWRTLLQSKERLDYVEDYQDLYTRSETFDVEVFSIPSEGLFMAAANRDARPGSGVYRWRNGTFQLYQNISTQEARAWKHFTINDKVFLVVADIRKAEPELSVVYRWNRRQKRFLRYQTLETHAAQDWEAFQIHNDSFLVVANHRRASDHNIPSVIYRWNPETKLFEVNQTLSTFGAYDWEFFTIGPYHFLVVANTFDSQTTTISSTIYVWLDGCFRTFQNITTVGATDWEMFQIDGRFFLAVANSQQLSSRGPSLYSINSTVYELNMFTQTFIRFQDILTHSAVDWEFFTVGDEKFLVVANSHDGSSYSLNSVVYRWQGYEGFVPVHSLPTFGCRDWEHFSTDEGSFLLYSSATSRLSKVFRLRTY
uniref:Thrombospondin type laminin G domain and EAR repeats n=1 Tax=Fundulus heteroclitus TaxID=8078 RepID=A0A3Q2TR28_FUNHE